MTSRTPGLPSACPRSRRQRLAAGAVLATTGLLGGYLAAFRPQPSYASPLASDEAQQPHLRAPSVRAAVGSLSIPACGQADDTVTTEGGLRSAILSSHDDSVICIDGTISLSADLPPLDDTTVTFVGDDSTADGIDGNYHRIILSDDTVATDDTVTIANLSLQHGVNGSGGAVLVYGGDLVISHSTFSDNAAAGGMLGASGGAVFARDGHVVISDSVFESNSSLYYGGGLYLASVVAIISNTTISGNNASSGSAISGTGSTLTASSVSITGNTSTYANGAAHFDASDARFENSFIGGNSTNAQAGGITAQASNIDLVFSTVYANSTTAGFSSQVLLLYGSLDSYGSVVGNSTDDTALYLGIGVVEDDTFSVSTGPGAVFAGTGSRRVAGGTLQMGALDDTQAPGHGGRTPALTSVLVTGAPTSNLSTGLNVDQVGNLRPGSGTTWTIGSRQVNFTPSPPNPPANPPSAPRNVEAEPGDGSATVSWDPPTDQGSFPITDYRVVAQPGGRSCLVSALATSCEVGGLTNGQPYTFTVEALNGAGWGPPSASSNPVTPASRVVRLTLNQGVRAADGRHDRITTTGSSLNVPAGVRLTPYIKYTGQPSFKRGKATITVQSDGSFDWSRQIRKDRGLTAYVAWEDVESNRVFWARVR